MNLRILKLVFLIFLFSLGTSCTKKIYIFKRNPNKSHHAPGQIKKRTGSKSAKPYAPGQKKKKDNNNQLYLQVIKKNQAQISNIIIKDSNCLPR